MAGSISVIFDIDKYRYLVDIDGHRYPRPGERTLLDLIVVNVIDAGRRRPDPDHAAIHLASIRAERRPGARASVERLVHPIRAMVPGGRGAPVHRADPACCAA
jgi:hypothetical protein